MNRTKAEAVAAEEKQGGWTSASAASVEPRDARGPIKNFPLRGIKNAVPHLHDDCLMTLEDTVQFFNVVLGIKLNQQ